MKTLWLALTFLALTAGLAACGNDDGGGDDTQATDTGSGPDSGSQTETLGETAQVSGALTSGGSALGGVSVEVSCDLDGNGVIASHENNTATSDATGAYTVEAPVVAGGTLVLKFSTSGFAKLIKTVVVADFGPLTVDGDLAPMASLTCAEGKPCEDEDHTVQISGIEIGGGYARVFNPATEADKFPGEFADDSGNMLISGVFGAFDLTDPSGDPITELEGGETAKVRMKVPMDTWPSFSDIEAGNGRIDVPMYSFNETTGQWIADGTGFLENGQGDALAESDLAAIRDKTFSGAVYAVAQVSHFSYWNVDWPIDTHSCIHGLVLDADGTPVQGAEVVITGLSYTGRSNAIVTGQGGSYCTDVLRSEAVGEDIDNNGVSGETHTVLVTAKHQGKLYRIKDIVIPTTQAGCPSGCLEVDIDLTPENEVELQKCHLEGTARIKGEPAGSVQIIADDTMLDDDAAMAFCPDCIPYAITDEAGAYTMDAVMEVSLGLDAMQVVEAGPATLYYEAKKTLSTCPVDPVDFDMDLLLCFVEGVLTAAVEGTSISWTPNLPLSMLIVTSANGGTSKWMVGSEAGFKGPVTYGTVPADAQQAWPLFNAKPKALASGDKVSIVPLTGMVPYEGMDCYQFGAETTVP